MASTSTNSAFDFLLADQPFAAVATTPNAASGGAQANSQAGSGSTGGAFHSQSSASTGAQSSVKSENGGLDWLLSDSDVLAPHPDAFELELESIAALGALEGDFATLPAFSVPDTFNPANFGLYTQYRGAAEVAHSAYSGYTGYGGAPSVITVSSESLSTYGSAYEPTPFEKHQSDLAAVSSGAQSQQQSQGQAFLGQQPSLASLFPDIDLNLTTFNLSAIASTNPTPTTTTTEQQPRSMQQRHSPSENDQNSGRSRGSSANYDPASPSYDSTIDFNSYLANAGALAAATYASNKQAQASSAGGSMPNVPRNGNAALVSASVPRDDVSDHDPRKKYQCPTCPRAFARAFNLKTHLATHDPHRVKNFVCRHSGCGRSFSRKHDLGRHLVSIHQDSNPPTGTELVGTTVGLSTPSAESSSAAVKPKASSSSIGVGSTEAQRVWCDSCGRGWLAGSRDICNCKGKERIH